MIGVINIKNIIKVLCMMIFTLLIVGCSKKNSKEIYKELVDKLEDLDSYTLEGELQMFNDDNSFKYSVSVNYLEDDNFKVDLINKSNNHRQIILRNNDGVYVITPSLNKSFKFQSEWPYNNSQSYLIQTIIKDLENDENRKYELNEKDYIFTSKVNYMNNPSLKYQKVYFDKKLMLKKVEIYDNDNNKKILMKIKKIKYNNKIKKETFNLDNNLNVDKEIVTEDKVSKIEDTIYPLYTPKDTKLKNQEIIKTSNGERLIQTFNGESSFTLIQETNNNLEYTNKFCEGEPIILNDVTGYIDDYSITWYDDNYSYYIVSKDLSQNELLQIASSITSPTIIK